MAGKYRIALALLGFAVVMYLAWYFQNIVVYLIISFVLSMIGHPLVKRIDRIKIWKFQMPHAVSSAITLVLMLGLMTGFIWFFVPLISAQAEMIANISLTEVAEHYDKELNNTREFLVRIDVIDEGETVISTIEKQVDMVIGYADFGNLFTNLLSTTGAILMAAFSILFITFFFLRDERMFENFLVLLVPPKYADEVRRIIFQSKYMLSRYFRGLIMELLSMITLLTIGLSILGVKNALVIGFMGGLFNIIPYLGPLIGGSMGVAMGMITALSQGLYDEVPFYFFGIIGVFAIANLIDNFLLQPLIYSKSVKSRPIEIFIVIIMAGTIAGIPGMILAIPGYTVLRIIAKEFLSNNPLVKKITEKL